MTMLESAERSRCLHGVFAWGASNLKCEHLHEVPDLVSGMARATLMKASPTVNGPVGCISQQSFDSMMRTGVIRF